MLNSVGHLMNPKATVFDPNALSKPLGRWLRADTSEKDTLTESGGSVSRWDDWRSNGEYVEQTTGSRQPLTGVASHGGKNGVRFDGADDYLTGDLDTDGELTIVAVARPMKNPLQNQQMQVVAQVGTWNGSHLSGFSMTTSPWATSNPQRVLNMNPAGGTAEQFVNGSDSDLTTVYNQTQIYSGTQTGGLYTNSVFYLCVDPGQLSNWCAQQDLFEILIYLGKLADGEIRALESYLNDHWGVY